MEKRVIVIGGGFAGLAAARTLQEAGHAHVTMLEASGSFGGRAKAVQLPDGHRAELGATWFHGIQGHPVYDLAVHFGLMSPTLKKGTNFWQGSQVVREGEAQVLDKEESNLVSHVISHYAKTVDDGDEENDSREEGKPATSGTSGQILRDEFEKFSQQWRSGSREATIVADAWGWREQLQRGIDGCDSTDDCNAAGSLEYADLPGPWPPVTGGYQAVAERIAEDLGDARLDSPVTELEWAGDSVRVSLEAGGCMEADAVIVTASLGVLKDRHATLFKPALPEAKISAIQRLGIGVVDKIFLTFEGIDINVSRRYEFLWRQAPGKYLPGSTFLHGASAIDECISETSTSSEKEPWYKGITSLRMGGDEIIRDSKDLTAPGNGSEAPPRMTRREHKQDDHNNQGEGLLRRPEGPIASGTLWISGHHATNMEKLSEAEVVAGINAVLEAFPAANVPRDFKVTRSRWGLNPYTRGSYSYIAADARSEDVATIIEPLTASRAGKQKPVVLFAGEHTTAQLIGTTAGAYLSGKREAERLINAFQD